MTVKKTFTKAYLLSIIIFVGIMTCFGLFIFQNTARTMKTQLGNKCIGIASAVAVLIEEDIDGFIELSQTLDMDTDYYRTIYPKLSRIRHENDDDIAFLYAQVRVSDTEIMYILDSEYMDDEFYTEAGYRDAITEPELEAYRTQQPYIPKDFVRNSYGTLLTCFVPLRVPATGEFVGLVGVDVSIDQYNDVMQNQLITVILSIGMLILLLVFSLLFSSNWLERIIARDNMTGAYNKAHFMRSLREQLRIAKRKGKPVTVLMLDLDHFKMINDTYGHLFGDVMLSALAGTISKLLRKMDCLGRYGGEEFSVYLPDTGLAAGIRVAERVRQAVQDMKVFNEEYNQNIQITISIGVAQATPGDSPQDILLLADKALYQAKKTRNTVAGYEQDAPE